MLEKSLESEKGGRSLLQMASIALKISHGLDDLPPNCKIAGTFAVSYHGSS